MLQAVLRSSELRRLELAYVCFKATETGTWLAMLVYAYGLGGATAAGAAAFAQLLPATLAAPLAGALADRCGAGRALVIGYAVQTAAVAATAAALFMGARAVVVFGGAVVVACALTCTRPAQAALTATLARSPEQLVAVNVVTGWIDSVGMLAAPAAAGVLLAAGGPGAVFAAMAIVLAAGSLAALPLRDASPASAAGAGVAEAAAAFRRVAADPDTRQLVALVACTFAGIGALDILFVVLAVDVLALGEPGTGYLAAAFGAGGIAAAGVNAALIGRRLAPALAAGASAWALALLVLSVAPDVGPALALVAVVGGARSVLDVAGRSLLQRTVPPTLLSRLFGVLEGLSMAGLALGSLLAPALVAVGGAGAALAGVAALPAAFALVGARRLLTIDGRTTVPVVEIALMRSSPLFDALATPTLERLARALQPVTFARGEPLIREGEHDDGRVYLVADGSVHVSRGGASLAELGRGATVGEVAAMRRVPRTATVEARISCDAHALSADAFIQAISAQPLARSAVDRLIESRLSRVQQQREWGTGSPATGPGFCRSNPGTRRVRES